MSDTFNFEEWLDGVRTPEKAVTVYTRPDLLNRPRGTELALGESSELEGSKTVFYLSSLSGKDERAIYDAYPDPLDPPMYPEESPIISPRANVEQSEAYLAAWKAYEANKAFWEAENAEAIQAWHATASEVMAKRGAERIARAIVKVKVGAGEPKAARLTASQVEELGERIGEAQLRLLVKALEDVTSTPPSEADPFQ